MKTNKSKQTIIETLSAYLDGQLSEQQEQVLRQRLEKDAALRNQLDDLRQTRYVLRQTPKLKRLRSFVLSPEMVKQQRTFFRAMNVSRMISAAASVLLVVFLGSQYLFAGGMRLASAPMADMANYEIAEDVTAAEPMMALETQGDGFAEEPAIGAAAEPVEEQMAVPEEEMNSEMADSTEEATGVSEADVPPPAVADEPSGDKPADEGSVENVDDAQATQSPISGGGEQPADEGDSEPDEEMALPTATLEGDQRALLLDKDLDETQVGEQEGAIPPELPEEEQVIPADEWETAEDQPSSTQISPMKVVQGVLLLLAVAGGLAAAYFRKKVR